MSEIVPSKKNTELNAGSAEVYDARWHPTHPAVFASTDGEGRDAQAAKKFGAAHNSFPHTQSVSLCHAFEDVRSKACGPVELEQKHGVGSLKQL